MDAQETKLAPPEPVVIPDSIDQCYELLGHENVVGMGDFGRDAGFVETVLVSPDAFRAMLGDDIFRGPTKDIPNRVIDALRELREAMEQYPGTMTPVVRDRTEEGGLVQLLVRQNLSAAPPFTVVTLS